MLKEVPKTAAIMGVCLENITITEEGGKRKRDTVLLAVNHRTGARAKTDKNKFSTKDSVTILVMVDSPTTMNAEEVEKVLRYYKLATVCMYVQKNCPKKSEAYDSVSDTV